MKSQKLEELLLNFKKSLSELGNETINELSTLAIDKINKNNLEVAFIGRFSVGKSTLINSLLGKDILPSSTGVSTSKLAFIKKGNDNFIKVNYKDGRSVKEDLSKQIIEKNSTDDNVLNFELFISDFPFSNTVFVDTPGVDDINNLRQDITYGYLPTADIVIFVLDVASILTKSELEFYRNHIASNYRDKVFLVFNKVDMEDNNFSEIDEKIKKTLNGLEINKNNKFLVSARNHLAGTILNKHELKEKSNISSLEQEINNYLSKVDLIKIHKNKVFDYIEKAKDLSIIQLKTSLDSIDKDKITLENELALINNEYKIIENKIFEIEKQLENNIKSINNCIDTYFESTLEEIRYEFKPLNSNDKIEFIKTKLPNKIRTLLTNIKENTASQLTLSVQLKDIPFLDDMFYSLLGNLEDGINYLSSIIVSFLYEEQKDKNDNKVENTKIKEFIGKILRKISSSLIHSRIETIFSDIMDTLKVDIKEQLIQYKNLITEEMENGEKAELEAKKISIERSISELESNRRIFSYTKESLEEKMKNIENIYFLIQNELGTIDNK